MSAPPCDRLVVAFELPQKAIPKGRPRFTRTGRTYTDDRTAAYEAAIHQACADAMTDQGVTTTADDVEVWAVFEQTDARRFDIDNAIKSLLDGMQGDGGAFVNDRQVVKAWAAMALRAPVNRVSVAVLRAES